MFHQFTDFPSDIGVDDAYLCLVLRAQVTPATIAQALAHA